MHFQNLFSAPDVGKIDIDLSIETTGTKKGTVKNIRTVGRRHNNNSFVGIEPVHLNEDLV